MIAPGPWSRFTRLISRGHQVERLVPADALVAGGAAVLRVALAVRVEVHPLHRVEQPVGRVDERLPGERVRVDRGLARRGEAVAARLDRPRLGVVLVELDGRDAQDAPVPHVDEDGPAVGVAGVAAHAAARVDAVLEAGGEHHLQRLGEPHGQVVRALDAHLEVLERVDELEVVAARLHHAGGDLRGVEAHGEVRRRVQPGARADLAAADDVGAPAASCRPGGSAPPGRARAGARRTRGGAAPSRAARPRGPQRRRELGLGEPRSSPAPPLAPPSGARLLPAMSASAPAAAARPLVVPLYRNGYSV